LKTVVESVTSEEEMLELVGTPTNLQTPTSNPETGIHFETPTKSNLSSRNNHLLEENYQYGAHPSSKEDSEHRAVSFEPMRGGDTEIDHETLSIPGSSLCDNDSFTSIPSTDSDFGTKVQPREDSLPAPPTRGGSNTQVRGSSRMSFTVDLETGKEGGREGHRALVRVRWFEASE
jgi:hypothetical protein